MYKYALFLTHLQWIEGRDFSLRIMIGLWLHCYQTMTTIFCDCDDDDDHFHLDDNDEDDDQHDNDGGVGDDDDDDIEWFGIWWIWIGSYPVIALSSGDD